MKRLFTFLILLFTFYIPLFAKTVKVGHWSNVTHTANRMSMILADPFDVYKKYDQNGNIIYIHNIRGKDTISYVPSGFKNYRININQNGSVTDYFDKQTEGDTVTLNIPHPFQVIDNDTMEGIIIDNKMIVSNIKGFDKDGKKVNLVKLEKHSGKTRAIFEKPIKSFDPTWYWIPSATTGDDAYIGNLGDANTAYGGDINLYLGSMADGRTRRVLIKFIGVVESLNAKGASSINSAKIRVSKRGAGADEGTRWAGVQRLTSAFTEATVTWNTKPSMTDDGDMADSIRFVNGGTFDDSLFIATKSLQALFAGATNYGFALTTKDTTLYTSSNYVDMNSIDGAGDRPEIIVDYNIFTYVKGHQFRVINGVIQKNNYYQVRQ